MMDQEDQGVTKAPEKFRCEYCGEAEFDTAMQLRGHQMKCKPRQEMEKAQEEKPTRRQERVPFGAPRARLNKQRPDDGYHYRVFNDDWRKDPGRVARALKAGYEVVDEPDSRQTVGTNEDGTEIKGVVMRIPKHLWQEDQKLKEEQRKIIDDQIHRGRHAAQQGDGRYVPSEGIRMTSKPTP